MNKYKRRRLRLEAAGKCPHCGKPSAPFYECDERREYKKMRRARKYATRPDDPRLLPRGKKRLWTKLDDERLREMLASNRPMVEICEALERKPLAVSARAQKLGLPYFQKCDELLMIASRLQ